MAESNPTGTPTRTTGGSAVLQADQGFLEEFFLLAEGPADQGAVGFFVVVEAWVGMATTPVRSGRRRQKSMPSVWPTGRMSVVRK